MLTQQEMSILIANMDQLLLERLDPINDWRIVHDEYHTQLAARIKRIDELVESICQQLNITVTVPKDEGVIDPA